MIELILYNAIFWPAWAFFAALPSSIMQVIIDKKG